MLSTGNDIVSLEHINILRTKQKRFYDNIVSSSELALYKPEMPFEIFIWLAWSIKESAFKYLKRQAPDLVFSPRKIIIQSITTPEHCPVNGFGLRQYEADSFCKEAAYHSTVSYANSLLHSKSVIHHELIYTVVNNDEHFKDTSWGIKIIEAGDPDAQSAEVRSFILKKLCTLLSDTGLNIEKSAFGYPVLLNAKRLLDIPISFTHHYYCIGYSFLTRGTY